MGLNFFKSSSSYDRRGYSPSVNKLPNPDPKNFRIMNTFESNGFLVIFINYPDCTNYEGNKILVFKNVTLKELQNQRTIDPHFSKNKKYHSPYARFEPTINGWTDAIKFVKLFEK